MPPDEAPLRERTRRAVQDRMTLAAIDLFVEQGYDATTVGQIAAAVGMSERTFFRYFSTKDDVLEHVSAHWRARVGADLAARPAAEPTWLAARRAFDGYVRETVEQGRALALLGVIYASPGLHGRHLLRLSRWTEAIAPALRARLDGTPDADFRTAVQAAVVVTCFEAARHAWVASGGESSLDELLDRAMESAARLLDGSA
ncbi:TetR family transcriptional regulator [Cellulomonas sp. DKR-3]|uniref:TetR family transcriptional regulator n=1 Tax=Cellulomonas fulva TaxID=2835530 RepID=A0ABS5TUX1_9CELL|nr:TetR family transcriptional regulator [Cellulomonas fulva]MBT0992955.1 TetR family transcriptional regulator [Cellulomonas fulva]